MSISVFENKPGHHYRTEIPNIIDDLDLSPYDFRLYQKIKRTCGDDGKCWKSIPHLAEEANMSARQVMRCLDNLSKPQPLLNGRSPILVYQRYKENRSRDTHIIEIVDVWDLNDKLYKKEKKINPKNYTLKSGFKHDRQVMTNSQEGGDYLAYKEDPYKNLEEEEKFHECLEKVELSQDEKRRLTQMPAPDVERAIKAIKGIKPQKTLLALILDAIKHPDRYAEKKKPEILSESQKLALSYNDFIKEYPKLKKLHAENIDLFESLQLKILLPQGIALFELDPHSAAPLNQYIRESLLFIVEKYGHVLKQS